MNHELRILQQKLESGEINRKEFREHITSEFDKLEDALMNDEITPAQHVDSYNELIKKEAEMYAEAFQPHEHI